MGNYTLEYIIQEWGKGNLTAEQVIGQVLLWVQKLQERLDRAETRLFKLEQRTRE